MKVKVTAAFFILALLMIAATIISVKELRYELDDVNAELEIVKAGQHQHQPADLSALERRVAYLETLHQRVRAHIDQLYTQDEQILIGLEVCEDDAWQCPVNEEELQLAKRVVMAESGNQPYTGQMAVAQCILDRMQHFDQTLEEIVLAENQFADPYEGEVTYSVQVATEAVFCLGARVCEEPILFFYSTVGGFVSELHERQHYVMTIDDHKFFN